MRNSKGFAKRAIATACSAAMAVALVPAVAFGADATATSGAADTGTAAVAYATAGADDVVLTVQTAQLEEQTNSKGAKIKAPKAGTVTTVKTYTKAELESLAAKNKTTRTYQYGGKGAATVLVSTSYVTMDQLLGGMKNWKSGAVANIGAADSSVSKTYTEVTQDSYYYPNYASGNPDASGKVKVPAALALSMKQGSAEGEATCAQAADSLKDVAATSDKAPRFVIGETEAEYAKGDLLRGMNFWSNVDTIVIGAENGSAPVAETSDTSQATKANTLKTAKSKVTVKKGKSAKVTVKSAKGKVTVKSSSKKIAKVSYSKKSKKVTIKGVKKGKATITVKAAGTSTYKAGKKTIKVTVK